MYTKNSEAFICIMIHTNFISTHIHTLTMISSTTKSEERRYSFLWMGIAHKATNMVWWARAKKRQLQSKRIVLINIITNVQRTNECKVYNLNARFPHDRQKISYHFMNFLRAQKWENHKKIHLMNQHHCSKIAQCLWNTNKSERWKVNNSWIIRQICNFTCSQTLRTEAHGTKSGNTAKNKWI